VKRAAACLLTGLITFILIGWGAGALWTSMVGSGEIDLMREISSHRSQAPTDLARMVTWAGSAFLLVPLALVAGALLVHAGLRVQALVVALALGGAMLISDAVKILVSRPRPPVEHLQSVSGFSFPSGHATQASAFWLSLVLAAGTAGGSAGRMWLLATGGLLLAALVGLSRVYLGVHYPSDVIAGILLGGGWAVWVTLCARRLTVARRDELPLDQG
jgi:membrane-associated phospholipid phosphatase